MAAGSAIVLSVRGIPFSSLGMRNDHGGSAKVLGARGIPLASLRLLNCFISSLSMNPQIPKFLQFFHSISFFLLLHQRTITLSISDMAITKDEGRIGGKFCKRPLRFPSTPYERPPSAVRGISRQQPAKEAGRSGWFSKLVDSAAQIIVKGVSRLSSVFGKGVASTPGENINTIEEVAEMKSPPPEVREEPAGNHIDIMLSIHYDGSHESKEELISHIDAFFQLKQLNKKESSRVETGQLRELLYPRTIEKPGYQKKKMKINNNSNINPSSSHQIREEDFGKFFTFGCKSQINHKDCQNNFLTKKVTRKSEMYKMARSPFFGCSTMTNTRVLKRGSSDRDEQFFDDARRVRRKTCLKDLNLTTHAGTASTPIILDQEQRRQRIDSKGLSNSGFKVPLACDLFAPPPRSTELAKFFFYELNKV